MKGLRILVNAFVDLFFGILRCAPSTTETVSSVDGTVSTPKGVTLCAVLCWSTWIDNHSHERKCSVHLLMITCGLHCGSFLIEYGEWMITCRTRIWDDLTQLFFAELSESSYSTACGTRIYDLYTESCISVWHTFLASFTRWGPSLWHEMTTTTRIQQTLWNFTSLNKSCKKSERFDIVPARSETWRNEFQRWNKTWKIHILMFWKFRFPLSAWKVWMPDIYLYRLCQRNHQKLYSNLGFIFQR